MVSDFLDFFIPSHTRDRVRDRVVDILIEVSSDERWRKLIRSFRSDARFHDAFDDALKRAVKRFATEYNDTQLVDALTRSTRFWDLPSVQMALKEVVTRPASYLETEHSTLLHSFANVAPWLEPERVELAVQFFLHCLAEEVINIPQFAPIYQIQLHKSSLTQAREMVDALRELQVDQRQWMHALLETLAQSQLLLTHPTAAPANLPVPKVYHNLPPRYGDFLGREKDLARVLDGLSSRWPLVSIEGLAGIGKTTLAIEAAHYCMPGPKAGVDQPFEVVVWVSAGDRPEQKRWMSDVLDTVASVLGYRYITQVPAEQKPVEVDHLLRNSGVLIIVDNFETIEDPELLAWIQLVPEPSKALITTRHHHLRRVWDIHLRGLGEVEALELIRRYARRMGLQTIEAAKEELLLPLIRITEGNPRVIEMALGHVKGGRLSLGEVVDHLYAASKTVEGIFDYLFAHAWEIMTREAQQVLLVMPFFADSASKQALGAASDLTDYYLDSALEQLVALALLDINEELATSDQRYSVHPLTRAFASTKLHEEQLFEEQARTRWSKYFVEFAARHIVREGFNETYWNVLTNREYKDLDLDWLNLRSVLAWADKQGQDHILIELMLLLTHYMNRRILYYERIYYAQRAGEAAERLKRRKDEAWLRIDALGWVYIEEGRFTDAKREIMTGLRTAQSMPIESSDAIDIMALANTFLARVSLEQGDVADASTLIEKVIALECSPLIRCRVNMLAGDIALKQNNYAEAIRLYEYATRITQEKEDVDCNALVRYRLGLAYLANGDLVNAETEFSRASANDQPGVNILVLYVKYGLACVAKARGETEKACRLAQDILEELSRFTSSHHLVGQINTFLRGLERE